MLHSSRYTPRLIVYTEITSYIHFQTEKRYKTIRHCCFLHTLYKRRGYVIIPKPHVSSRECINSRCRRFDLLFSPCWPNLSLLTTLTERVLVGHGRSITSESGLTPLFIQYKLAREWLLAIVHGCFSRIKKMLARTEARTRERIFCQTIRTVRDISRDDRARIATCHWRTSTDRQTDLRRIIV